MRIVCLGLFALSLLAAPLPCLAENWGRWRGPRGDGTSAEKNVPTVWDGETGKNIRWKTEIPGQGHASPIVWNDRVYQVTCKRESTERVLMCLDADTGNPKWERTVLKSKLETKHRLNSYASSTPATDGKTIFVTFLEVDGHTIPAPNVSGSRLVTPGEIVVSAYEENAFPTNEHAAPASIYIGRQQCSG